MDPAQLPNATDDPLAEASDTLESLIEHYHRQQQWIQRAQETMRAQQQGASARIARQPLALQTPPGHQQPDTRQQQQPQRQPSRTPTPTINVANLLQMYGSIVSERVESCRRTAELIREADRLSLEKFECVARIPPARRRLQS
ncbi:hypothetical protein AURDEDRAFT_156950 [Auricularia subglabra TFB-10046 SS5]|nr:hypothetical protein AURDEDRAFT_156950 [Auricularia subglabra TFB-10046 SS5]